MSTSSSLSSSRFTSVSSLAARHWRGAAGGGAGGAQSARLLPMGGAPLQGACAAWPTRATAWLPRRLHRPWCRRGDRTGCAAAGHCQQLQDARAAPAGPAGLTNELQGCGVVLQIHVQHGQPDLNALPAGQRQECMRAGPLHDNPTARPRAPPRRMWPVSGRHRAGRPAAGSGCAVCVWNAAGGRRRMHSSCSGSCSHHRPTSLTAGMCASPLWPTPLAPGTPPSVCGHRERRGRQQLVKHARRGSPVQQAGRAARPAGPVLLLPGGRQS